MTPPVSALLDAFERLSADDKRAFTEEVSRRSFPFDSDPIKDEEISQASAALFGVLAEEDANFRKS